MSYLLGTNVLSELRKQQPNRHVLAWYDTVSSAEIFVSVLSIGEIRLGMERRRSKDPARAEALETWLHRLRAAYSGHIIGVDAEAAEEWGRMNVPRPLPVIDGLLAASARVRGWTLVTRNTADVARCGVQVLDPFKPASTGPATA